MKGRREEGGRPGGSFFFFFFFITEHTQVTPGLPMLQRFCDNIYTIIYYASIPYIHMLVSGVLI